jgi:hypothetical protein
METIERTTIESQTTQPGTAQAQTTQAQPDCPMQAAPQKEHAWLQQFIGEWTYESECLMGPDQPAMKSSGTETVRSLGGFWVIGEGQGEMPDGEPATMIITLGFDPQKGRFVGTFVGSMMANLWVYDGSLDADERVLTLEADGPSFTNPTATAKYRDSVELVSPDHRILRSTVLGDDGTWIEFMTAHYRRV